MSAPQALLFDVGNVLIDIDFEKAAQSWAQADNRDWRSIMERFRPDRAYEAHERGEIDWATYCVHLRDGLGLKLDDQVLAAGWNTIFRGPCDGIESLLSQVPEGVERYGFSNTNAVHHNFWSTRYAQIFEPFTDVYCSHLIGHRKPDPKAFNTVLEHMGLAAEHVLFFDDAAENIQAASALGIQAVHVGSPQDTRDGLVRAGLLD